jgi:hypothetical protein
MSSTVPDDDDDHEESSREIECCFVIEQCARVVLDFFLNYIETDASTNLQNDDYSYNAIYDSTVARINK